MTATGTLLILNLASVCLILSSLWVMIFSRQVPHGRARNFLTTTLSFGLILRIIAIYIAMVVLRSNSLG